MLNNEIEEKELKTLTQLEKPLTESVEHITELKRILENFTLDKVNDYCKQEDDDPNRIILRASEILINRHLHEFNLITTQLINPKLAEDPEEILEFNKKWLKQGLPFD